LDDLYARLDAAMRKPGQVLHATIDLSATPDDGSTPITLHEEIWTDLPGNAGRSEITETRQPASMSVTLIVANGLQYAVGHDGSVEAPTCHGNNSPVVSLLLACEGGTAAGESQTTLDLQTEYGGRSAVATISTLGSPGEGASDKFTSRVYFDRETWLPFAFTSDGEAAGVKVHTEGKVLSEFVDRQSLDPGFFDPKSN
jgi:hypothetical protein